jgi:hypothetical protein
VTAHWPVTGIGSLGHVDPAAAVRDVLALGLDVPFWPQLPRRGAAETMVYAAAAATRLLEPLDARGAMWRPRARAAAVATTRAAVERAEPSEFAAEPPGLAALAATVGSQRVLHLKGQWTGPATLAAAVVLEGGVALADDAPTLAGVLDALHLTCLAQARSLLRHADRVDLWLDEPLVGTLHRRHGFDVDAARAWYARLADACGDRVRLGVHSCAGFDPVLVELGVPVVSCIAGLGTGAHAAAIRRQLERGFMAWGVVPTGADATVSEVTVTATIDACVAELDLEAEHVATRSLLTPDCGFAGLDAAAGIARLRLLRDAALGLRARSKRR